MVFTHFSGDKYHSDIRLTEKQALDIHDRCVVCHQAEYAGWLASGHAVNYKEIFMDEEHNRMEKPYWDCLRCHGMFYDGNIHDLMSLEGDEPSGWHIKDRKQEALPTIPCLACHQIHTDNSVSERYVSMIDSSRFTKVRHPRTALYVRADKMHLRSDYLTKVTMIDDDGREVESSGEPNNLLCMQCHSPDNNHHAGSQDDRTPTGVHEGISCIACHKPHTGNARETCFDCHSSLTTQEIEAVYRNPHHFNVEK